MTFIAGWVALAAAAASAYNTNQVAKKSDRIAATGIRKQAENQQKVNQRLNEQLDRQAKSRPDEARDATNVSYIDQIRRNMGRANQGLRTQGISQAFDQLATQEAGAATDYAGTIAGLMSRIDAGTLQRQQERNGFTDLGMDLGVIGGDIQGDQFLNGLAMKGVRRNPWIDLAAGAASGYASNYGGGGG